MRLRLRNLDNVINSQAQSKEPERNRDASITPSWRRTTPHGSPEVKPEGVQRNKFQYAFEEDLLASRVYRKHLFNISGDPLVTSAARTTAWSILSGISLTDVSNISILSIPIFAHEISNSARYNYSDIQPESLAVDYQETASNAVQQILKVEKRGGFDRVASRNQGEAAKPDALRQPEPKVLGVPLQELIRYNNMPIQITDRQGGRFFIYIPRFVGRIGKFLKEKGQSVSNYKVHTSSLTMNTQHGMLKIYSASVSLAFA